MFSIHRPSKRNENFQLEMYASKHTEIPNNGLSITTETNFLCVQAQPLLLKSNTEPILNNRLKFLCIDPPFLSFFSFSYSFPLEFWRRTFFFDFFFHFSSSFLEFFYVRERIVNEKYRLNYFYALSNWWMKFSGGKQFKYTKTWFFW